MNFFSIERRPLKIIRSERIHRQKPFFFFFIDQLRKSSYPNIRPSEIPLVWNSIYHSHTPFMTHPDRSSRQTRKYSSRTFGVVIFFNCCISSYFALFVKFTRIHITLFPSWRRKILTLRKNISTIQPNQRITKKLL